MIMLTYALGKPDEDSDSVTLSDADVEVVDKSLHGRDECSYSSACCCRGPRLGVLYDYVVIHVILAVADK